MKKQSKMIIGIAVGVLLMAVIVIAAVLMSSSNGKRQYAKHMNSAQRYMDELQYEQAIAEYEAAIVIEPNNTEAYEALVKVYMTIGDYEAALEILNRGVARTGSEELETYQGEVLEMAQSSALIETDTDASESPENDLMSENDDLSEAEMPSEGEEQETSSDNAVSDEASQDESGAVTVLITWEGSYGDGTPIELDISLTGTMDDGSELFANDGTSGDTSQSSDGELEMTSENGTQGSYRMTLYRMDGVYQLEVADGIGYAIYNTNGLPDSFGITLIDAEGTEIPVDVEAAMYRADTGIWFCGIGIDHGMLTDYDA
ncbi:MAG: tetratricopeptide repeat protein [bacterium]|nr:tetratricopeptide repeat protein [bacterium]